MWSFCHNRFCWLLGLTNGDVIPITHAVTVTPITPVITVTPITPFTPAVSSVDAPLCKFEMQFLDNRVLEQARIMFEKDVCVVTWPSRDQQLHMPLWQITIVNRVRSASPHVYPIGSISAPEFIAFEWQCLDILRFQENLDRKKKWPTKAQRAKFDWLQLQTLKRAEKHYKDPLYKGFRTV